MKQSIWNDIDLIKGAVYGGIIGFMIGVMVGYEWAWQPVVKTFRPMIG
jgi:hypothetical protein